MFLTVRKYSGVTKRDEVVARVEKGLIPLLQALPGFIAYYATEFENGDLGGISVYDTKQNADDGADKALSWVQENLSELMPNAPEVMRGEVLAHAGSGTMSQTA